MFTRLKYLTDKVDFRVAAGATVWLASAWYLRTNRKEITRIEWELYKSHLSPKEQKDCKANPEKYIEDFNWEQVRAYRDF